MKKTSEHIRIYLIQKESLFSIFGRISINATLFLLPLVITLDYYPVYFLYKWLFVLSITYHLIYALNKLLVTYLSNLGLIVLFLFILSYWSHFEDDYLSFVFLMLVLTHVSVALVCVFVDYILSDLQELYFFNAQAIKEWLSDYFTFYLSVFILFWYL